MTDKIYLGIDPGKTGAVCWINEDESEYGCHYTPKTLHEMAALIRDISFENKIIRVTIEDVHARGGMSAGSQGLMMNNKGQWEGICSALGVPIFYVSPKTWQCKIIKEKIPKGKTKEYSMATAQRMYPLADIKLKKDDGKADALLICKYGKTYL